MYEYVENDSSHPICASLYSARIFVALKRNYRKTRARCEILRNFSEVKHFVVDENSSIYYILYYITALSCCNEDDTTVLDKTTSYVKNMFDFKL